MNIILATRGLKMPKGRKRTSEDYEREIEEAAKRMQKYPEHLRAARDSDEWLEFLNGIGVGTTDTRQGQDFWESVRDKMYMREVGFSVKRLAELNSEVYNWVSSKGKSVIQYRDKETGRFISYKQLENRY